MGKRNQNYLFDCLRTDFLHEDDTPLQKMAEMEQQLGLLVDNHHAAKVHSYHYSRNPFSHYYTMSAFMIKHNPDLKKFIYNPAELGLDEERKKAEEVKEVSKVRDQGLYPGIYIARLGDNGSENYAVLIISPTSDDTYDSTTTDDLYIVGKKHQKYLQKYYRFYSKLKKLANDALYDTVYDKTSTKPFTFVHFKSFDKMIFKEKDNLIKYIDHFIDNIPAYHKYGITPKLSILLYGKPGTGKSTVAQAIAKYMDIPAIQCVRTEHIVEQNMDDRRGGPRHYLHETLLVLDDIDCMCASRDEDDSKENKAVVQQLLSFLDTPETFEYKARDGKYYPISIIVATTNYYDKLDSAIKRHGRFDLSMEMKEFDKEDASKMCDLYDLRLKDVVKGDIDKKDFVISPAKLQALCMENINSSLRDDKSKKGEHRTP